MKKIKPLKETQETENKRLKYIRISKEIEYQINLVLLERNRQTPHGAKKITFGKFIEECVDFYFTHQKNDKV